MSDKVILKQTATKLVYREGDRVVKSFVPSHPKSDVFNEAFIQVCVEESGVPVPHVTRVFQNEEGGWALEMEHVEGKTMRQLIEENPDKTDEYLERFVEIQLEVGSHRARRLRNTKIKMSDAVKSLTDVDASTRYELQTRIGGMANHTKLCHGNFVPSNVVIRPDGSYCILDWAHATSGNAGGDAAATYLMFSIEKPELADKYLHIYAKKADMAIQYIQRWMPVVAAYQMTKHVPGEREILEDWISVAEYQ